MTGAGHYRRAEELAEEARDRLSQGDNQGAIACAAIAQVHATLAQVPATLAEVPASQRGHRQTPQPLADDQETALDPDKEDRAVKGIGPKGGGHVQPKPGQ